MIFLQHEKGWDNMLTKTRQKEILKLLENSIRQISSVFPTSKTG